MPNETWPPPPNSRYIRVTTELPAVVVTLLRATGDSVDPDHEVVLLESMKMEIPVLAQHGGLIHRMLAVPGETVGEGDGLFVIDTWHRS